MGIYDVKKMARKDLPKQLLEIPGIPKSLYLKGNMPPEGNVMLCVVGARSFTQYGKDICEKLIMGLRGRNVTIVSGLALGIDGIAHQAALAAGLNTIALPGSGLNETALHPQSHTGLSRRILEAGGGLLSEYEPDFKATQWSFPQRNRLMAGLSKAVLIIEAEKKSGTLITARLATEYNRDVLVVPGSVFAKNSEGPHLLLRLGATPITCVGDLELALGYEPTTADAEKNYDDCSKQEKMLIEILRDPMPRDQLIRLSKLDTSEANMFITLLEMKGHIKESLGEIRLT